MHPKPRYIFHSAAYNSMTPPPLLQYHKWIPGRQLEVAMRWCILRAALPLPLQIWFPGERKSLGPLKSTRHCVLFVWHIKNWAKVSLVCCNIGQGAEVRMPFGALSNGGEAAGPSFWALAIWWAALQCNNEEHPVGRLTIWWADPTLTAHCSDSELFLGL